MNDMVNHPSHYQSSSGLEVSTVIKAFTEHLQGSEATHTGNIIKYICRWKKKDGLRDLQKARKYIDMLIADVEENEAKQNEAKKNIVKNYRYIPCISLCEAEVTMTRLGRIMALFGEVTGSDIRGILGFQKYDPQDERIYWTSVSGTRVRRESDGRWTVVLPMYNYRKGE